MFPSKQEQADIAKAVKAFRYKWVCIEPEAEDYLNILETNNYSVDNWRGVILGLLKASRSWRGTQSTKSRKILTDLIR